MGNVCKCQKPPGGEFECPPNSMPVCRLEDGICKGKCYEAPDNLEGTPLPNWALSIIIGENRSPNQPLSFDDNEILRSGRHVIENRLLHKKVIITFNISNLEGLTGNTMTDRVGV